MRRLMALVALGLGLGALAAGPAGADFPGTNGRIAFMRQDGAGLWQTWVASADLSGQAQLTSGPADSGWPVWSPGGAKLAFDSDRADPDLNDSNVINDIFTMKPDGSDVVKLTDSQGFSGDAAWSPDGTQIAFDSDRGSQSGGLQIWVMHADGSHLRRITTLPPTAENDQSPRFSPDGTRLVFTRYRGGSNEGAPAAEFTVGTDGRGLQQLTSFKIRAGDADWSPDGMRIVFEADGTRRFSHGDVYVVNADGQHLKNVTRNGRHGGAADPVWAPDGTKLLFLRAQVVAGGLKIGLATMNPDGSAKHFVSSNPMEEHQPDWESVRRKH